MSNTPRAVGFKDVHQLGISLSFEFCVMTSVFSDVMLSGPIKNSYELPICEDCFGFVNIPSKMGGVLKWYILEFEFHDAAILYED